MSSQSGLSAKTIIVNIFVAVCIIGLVFFGVSQMNQLTSTREALTSTQNNLTTAQADLTSTKALLTINETELSQTQSDLSSSRTELSDTQSELQTATQTLEDKSSQLAQAQADYTASLKTLNTEKGLSAELQSRLDNLQANYASLTTGYGYVLRDPTYQQVKTFIAADGTDANLYVDDSYVCEDFAYDVITHALQQKIRCAYVSIRFFGDNSGHAIIAFNTTDRGIIYIEPQSDEEVILVAGRDYWTQCVIASPGHYYLDPSTYNDTVDRFNVIW